MLSPTTKPAVVAAALATLLVLPVSAGAAFPGKNGRVVFRDYWPCCSPTPPQKLQLFTVKPDGSDKKRLTRGPGEKGWPSFSPSGRRIVFAKEIGDRLAGNNFDLFVINANGRDRTRLTHTRRRFEGWPSFSPNGKRIVFARRRIRRTHQQFDLYIMRANGSHVRRLTNTSVDDRYPQFSPAGGRIAWQRFRPFRGSGNIHLMDPDGTNRSRLTEGSSPSFSPDGSRIAFDHAGIWRIDVDGTNRVRLTSTGLEPAYSPNGERIVFERYFPTEPSGGGDFFSLFTITDDGTDERRLTRRGLQANWGPKPK